MLSDRTSQPVTRVDTPHDRAADTPHYDALERARDGGRRAPRRRPSLAATLARSTPPPGAPVPSHDDVRGTRLNVIA